MFGFDRFSLARFSLGSEDNTYPISQTFSETLNAVAGIAIPVATTAFFNDVFRGETKGAIMVPFGCVVGEELVAAASMRANINIIQQLSGELSATVAGAKDIHGAASFTEQLSANPYAGKDMPMVHIVLSDGLSTKGEAGKDILAQLLAAEVLTTLTNAVTQETEQVEIQVTLPPGGELRIDSDTYRVLLNGENALHLQSGDWIKLTRSLQYLDVESATGGTLSGSVIYTERYL